MQAPLTAGDSSDADDLAFMRKALELAKRAGRAGEVPVGALVVMEGRCVGEGYNRPIALSDPTAHAEIDAMRDACATLGNYRLTGATLYCTVEPCVMCMGAVHHARVDRLVYGAPDPKVGAVARWEGLRASGAVFNHRVRTEGGVLAEESSELLRQFFRERRDGYGEVPKWS